jgi:hypothetical protein
LKICRLTAPYSNGDEGFNKKEWIYIVLWNDRTIKVLQDKTACSRTSQNQGSSCNANKYRFFTVISVQNNYHGAHKLQGHLSKFQALNTAQEAIMTEILLTMEPASVSCEDTIFVISPNDQIVENVRDFVVQRHIKLWIGDPKSPDVIAVPYKVGIVDKYWMDPKSWADWIEFLRETRGDRYDDLLIIILPHPFSEEALDEIKREFEDAHEPVHFLFGGEGKHVVKVIANWLDTGSIEQFSVCEDVTSTIAPNNSEETRQATFRERLDELMNRFTVEETKHKVSVDVYFKYRIQAKWLLTKFLGGNHLYTKELDIMFAVDMDPFAVGGYLLAAKGILEALKEDLDNGLVQVKEGA